MATPSTGKYEEIKNLNNNLSIEDQQKRKQEIQAKIDQANRDLNACKAIAFELNAILQRNTSTSDVRRAIVASIPVKDPLQGYNPQKVRPPVLPNNSALTVLINDFYQDTIRAQQRKLDNDNKMQSIVDRIKDLSNQLNNIGLKFPETQEEALKKLQITLPDIQKKDSLILFISILDQIQSNLPTNPSNKDFLDREVTHFITLLNQNPDILSILGGNINNIRNQLYSQSGALLIQDSLEEAANKLFVGSDLTAALTTEARDTLNTVTRYLTDPTVAASSFRTPPGGDIELTGFGDEAKDPALSIANDLTNPQIFFTKYLNVSETDLIKMASTLTDPVQIKKFWELVRIKQLYPGLSICNF